MHKTQIDKYCDIVRQNAFELHRYLGSGHIEKIYENGLSHRLTKANVCITQQFPIIVQDEDGTPIGDFKADLLVENQILIECKAVKRIHPKHVSQLLGYLRCTSLKYGLLVNFGADRFQIKKYIFTSHKN